MSLLLLPQPKGSQPHLLMLLLPLLQVDLTPPQAARSHHTP
jgi:hypothetical protein